MTSKLAEILIWSSINGASMGIGVSHFAAASSGAASATADTAATVGPAARIAAISTDCAIALSSPASRTSSNRQVKVSRISMAVSLDSRSHSEMKM